MLHLKRPPIGDAPRWLSHEQIKRRLDVLKTVKGLLDRPGSHDHADIESRFRHEVAGLASRALDEAEWALRRAAMACGEHGGAPVERDVLELVRCFNAVGPTRLKTLLKMKGALKWA